MFMFVTESVVEMIRCISEVGFGYSKGLQKSGKEKSKFLKWCVNLDW